MKSFIQDDGSHYYAWERASPLDLEVPDRPTPYHIWLSGKWVQGPLPVPEAVTPLQARLALSAAGLLDQVNAAATAGGVDTELAWYFAKLVERNSAFVANLGAALNLTSDQIDDLFRSAATFAN